MTRSSSRSVRSLCCALRASSLSLLIRLAVGPAACRRSIISLAKLAMRASRISFSDSALESSSSLNRSISCAAKRSSWCCRTWSMSCERAPAPPLARWICSASVRCWMADSICRTRDSSLACRLMYRRSQLSFSSSTVLSASRSSRLVVVRPLACPSTRCKASMIMPISVVNRSCCSFKSRFDSSFLTMSYILETSLSATDDILPRNEPIDATRRLTSLKDESKTVSSKSSPRLSRFASSDFLLSQCSTHISSSS
mmetsp:Transcript_47246/g.98903  ORF Transcript_47246/g.98903 Transcript_47246/m.98903 type:complete len:255 (-) Transcript_47246:428-1192(-)